MGNEGRKANKEMVISEITIKGKNRHRHNGRKIPKEKNIRKV